MIPSISCFPNAVALAALCGALAWSSPVAFAADRVIAHWDMSSPDASPRIIPAGANSEAGDLKFPAASTATIEKDSAVPGGQALVFPKVEPGGKSANKVAVAGDFSVELLVKVSPDNNSEKSLTIVFSPFFFLTYKNENIGFNVRLSDGYQFLNKLIQPGKWIAVTARVEGGRMTLSVDGDSVEKSLPPDAKPNGEENLISVGGVAGSIAKLVVTAK